MTGARGFIGSHLCKRLIAEGHEVHGVSRRAARSSDGDPMKWWQADLASYERTCALLQEIRPDVVFHLASRVTGSRELSQVVPLFQANLASTVNVLTSCAELGRIRVVLAGSSEEPPLGNATPCSPYAAAKSSGTSYARMFHSLFRLPVLVARIFMTYGPGQADVQKLVPYTITSLLQGKRPQLSRGLRLVDWIFIDDVVEGLIRAALMPHTEQVTLDLGSGSLTSIRALVEQIIEIIGVGATADFGALPDRAMEPERAADVDATERFLHWKPQKVLREGIEETVDWYRRNPI